jgi:hypothetical protein
LPLSTPSSCGIGAGEGLELLGKIHPVLATEDGTILFLDLNSCRIYSQSIHKHYCSLLVDRSTGEDLKKQDIDTIASGFYCNLIMLMGRFTLFLMRKCVR